MESPRASPRHRSPRRKERLESSRWFSVGSISRVINHMTCYNLSALMGGKFILKKSFTRFALQSECCNFNQWEHSNYNRSCDWGCILSQELYFFLSLNGYYLFSPRNYTSQKIIGEYVVSCLSPPPLIDLFLYETNQDHKSQTKCTWEPNIFQVEDIS